MKVSGVSSLFNAAMVGLASLNDAKSMNKKALMAQAAQNSAALDQASSELAEQLSSTRTGYEMSQENVDLSQIWQRARDWGLGEQTEMALEARDVAVRSANEATLTDSQRQSMDAEVSAMAAETTRIGLTNNINGSHTLARFGKVEEITEVEKEVEVEEEKVTETKPQIDVLWVVDRSGSMSAHIAHIKEDASKMFKALEEKGFEGRMAIESFEWSLDNNGSTDFRSDIATFKDDVTRVLGHITGGTEKGLESTEQAIDRFGSKFNPDATKVTILLSDEYSDDFLAQEHYFKSRQLLQTPEAEQLRQNVADALKSVGSEFYVVGINENTSPDKDYTDVIDKVGKGAAIKMDYQGKWVDEVTKNFIASVEKDVEAGKSKKTVTETVVTTKYELLDEWEVSFQVGPGADEHIVETFKTSTAETSGLSKADASTAEKARNSINVIDDALDFLSDNRTQVGALESRFAGISNDLAERALTPQDQVKALTDAFNPRVNTSLWGLLSIHLKRS